MWDEYLLAFDEINKLTAYSYYTSDTVEQVIDDILSMLIKAYLQGLRITSDALQYDIELDTPVMMEVIYTAIEGKTWEDRVREYYKDKDESSLKRLVETEYHRIVNTTILKTGQEYEKIKSESALTKTWITMRDSRVRETHTYLEGQTVGLNEMFYTYDGDQALYPGGFGKASNNVNCRCIIMISK